MGDVRIVSLGPDAPPEADAALRAALHTIATDAARGRGDRHADAWRHAALAEGVERDPMDGAAPAYASPRSSRGATRA